MKLNPTSAPIDDGILPPKRFALKSMNDNFVKAPIALGMVPEKQFPWRYSFVSPVRYPMSDDRYPF